LDEAAALARAGAVELVLAGCNLAAYRDGPTGLAELAAAVAGCPGVARVRLGSVEPGRVEDALVDLMVADDRICRTLHLPVQSGDGGVLRAMGRRYTPERYAETVWRAAGRLSDLGVGTDVLVGFPGEDDAAFGRTMDLVRSLPFGNVHVFAFSPRPGTRAASMSAQVPAGARRERLRAMLALAAEKRREFAGRFVGRTVRVLIERVTAAGEGRGWSGSYVDCRVPGLSAASVGRIVDFTPRSAGKGTLL
jgi:threonylcarbamoyladenosine tRNA methylthiotransferase MtaB